MGGRNLCFRDRKLGRTTSSVSRKQRCGQAPYELCNEGTVPILTFFAKCDIIRMLSHNWEFKDGETPFFVNTF